MNSIKTSYAFAQGVIAIGSVDDWAYSITSE